MVHGIAASSRRALKALSFRRVLVLTVVGVSQVYAASVRLPRRPLLPSPLADVEDVSSSRPGVSMQRMEQPPDTLADTFPGFERMESELALMGQPGLTTRASTLGRMTASELLDVYEKSRARAAYLRGVAAEVSAELQGVGRDMSEALLFLAWHRIYDTRRVPPAPRARADADMEMQDDEAPASSDSLPADT